MVELTTAEKNVLNNLNPSTRKMGLGTKINNILKGSTEAIEAKVGTVNTNFAVVDDCEALNIDTFSSETIFTATSSTTRYKVGSKSQKISSLTTSATLNQLVYNVIVSADWSGSSRIGFPVFADVALAEGEVEFYIKDNVASDQTVAMPALSVGWNWVELDVSGLTLTAVIRYGFKRKVAKVFNLWVDDIKRYLIAETVTVAQTPIEGSVKIATIKTEEAQHHTLATLAENTDFKVNPTAKRIIFVTDQSTYNCLIFYNY